MVKDEIRHKTIYNVLLILLFCSFSYLDFSQIDSTRSVIRKNSVFAEGLGNAGFGFYSLNYDRLFLRKNSNSFSLRIGGSCYSWDVNQQLFSFPLLLNTITGHKNNHFELGIGCVVHIISGHLNPRESKLLSIYHAGLTANIGYRYQRPAGGFFSK